MTKHKAPEDNLPKYTPPSLNIFDLGEAASGLCANGSSAVGSDIHQWIEESVMNTGETKTGS